MYALRGWVGLVVVWAVLCVASGASALTAEQLATFATDIAADAAFATLPRDTTGAQVVATAYTQSASPAYWVWKTRLTQEDVTAQVSADGTSWSWTTYIARSQGERDAFRDMFIPGAAGGAAINPSLPNVRAGLADIFSGGTGAAQRTHLLAVARRLATRGEKLFATGSGTTGAPSVMSHEGRLSAQDVIAAWTQ